MTNIYLSAEHCDNVSQVTMADNSGGTFIYNSHPDLRAEISNDYVTSLFSNDSILNATIPYTPNYVSSFGLQNVEIFNMNFNSQILGLVEGRFSCMKFRRFTIVDSSFRKIWLRRREDNVVSKRRGIVLADSSRNFV